MHTGDEGRSGEVGGRAGRGGGGGVKTASAVRQSVNPLPGGGGGGGEKEVECLEKENSQAICRSSTCAFCRLRWSQPFR